MAEEVFSCDHDWQIVPDGVVLTCKPPLYPHRCSKCGGTSYSALPMYPAADPSEAPAIEYLQTRIDRMAMQITTLARRLDAETGWKRVLHIPQGDSVVSVRASDLKILLEQNGGLHGRGFASEDDRVDALDRLYRALGLVDHA